MTVSRRYAGKTVRCPKCSQKVRIPSAETIERKLREKRERLQLAAPAAAPPRGETTGPTSETDTALETRPSQKKRPPPRNRRALPPPKSRPREHPPQSHESESRPGEKPPIRAQAQVAPQAQVALPVLETTEAAPPAPPIAEPADVPLPAPPPVAEHAASANNLALAEPAATAAETLSDEPSAVRGYEPERERRWTCYFLGISLAAIGLFGAAPAVLEITEFLQSDQTIPVARWAWLALLTAAMHLAYAFYAAQLPDWSTAWVVTLVGAAVAVLYAALLGLTLVAGAESRIVAFLELEEQLAQGRAARWCFVMLGVLGLYAYFGGRSALRWRHSFNLTRPLKQQTPRPARLPH